MCWALLWSAAFCMCRFLAATAFPLQVKRKGPATSGTPAGRGFAVGQETDLPGRDFQVTWPKGRDFCPQILLAHLVLGWRKILGPKNVLSLSLVSTLHVQIPCFPCFSSPSEEERRECFLPYEHYLIHNHNSPSNRVLKGKECQVFSSLLECICMLI